jgi:hypothetical protein
MKRIVIKASEVAACVGQNRFKPASEVRDDMWKRYSPETFLGQTKEDVGLESLAKSDGAQTILKQALAVRAKSSDEAETVFLEAQKAIKALDGLSIEDKANVTEMLRSRIYTTHGTRSEARTANKVTAEEGTILRPDNAFYEYEVCVLDMVRYVIVGKVDRIEHLPDGRKVLIEIKNRTKKLFRQVYPAENIQIQTYLQMLRDMSHAKLIEQYNQETNTMLVERDDDLWQDEVLPELVNFCRELHEKF